MSSNLDFTNQKRVLTNFQQAIEELGYDTKLFEQLDDPSLLKAPLLLVGLPQDSQGRDRTLNFTFVIQDDQDDFDYLSLVQCYTPLFFEVLSEHNGLANLILAVNNHVPIGHFGLNKKLNLFYRYVITSEKWALIEPETLQQMLVLFVHILDTFTPLINSFITEEKTLEEILQTL